MAKVHHCLHVYVLMYLLSPTIASGTLHSSVSAEGPTLQTKLQHEHNSQFAAFPAEECRI